MYNAWNHTLFEFTKRPNKAYQWPKSSPHHQPSPRFTRRSQLRFSPAKTVAERWVRRCLLQAHSLLKTGDDAAALALCYDQITVPRDSCLEFLHSAVSLFTRHGSFDAALELCNHMIDIGFLLQNKTFMLLLRGGHSQRGEFIDDVRAAMARGGVRMDDLTFKSILDTMVKHRCPPTDLEDALYTYQKSQEKNWVPTVGIYHTIIQAWAFSGALDRAEHWLARYRDGRQQRGHSDNQESSTRDNPRKLYAAVITGLARSKKPVAERIQELLNIMREDGIFIDIDIYNMIMCAQIQWGMKVRAFRMYEGLLSEGMLRRGSLVIPDAYTFRQIFIALNPRRRHTRAGSGSQSASQQVLLDDISTRRVFSDLIRVSRLRLRTRKPLPHKNLISTATFNCALGTFCAQDDYAAAWTVLALFTWFHIVPDAKTSRIVVNSLLRRMRYEMSPAHNMTDVLWMDRFSNERRSVIATRSDKVMFLDRLYFIGRVSVDIIRHEKFQRYLKPSFSFDEDAAIHLEFMIALLRSALQAQLGFQSITFPAAEAEREIRKAMLRARNDMVPRGRSERN